jgi:large-conductance mechanosensitive channel
MCPAKAGHTSNLYLFSSIIIQFMQEHNTVIEFLIVALAIFLIIKVSNSLMQKVAAAPAEAQKPSNEDLLIVDI